jgi:hypothetical protein
MAVHPVTPSDAPRTHRRTRFVVAAVVLTVAVILWLRACAIPQVMGLADRNVQIIASGGTGTHGLDFDFAGMLPGTTRTAPIDIRNPTDGPEAVWLVFDNDNGTWSAINRLGQLGRITVGDRFYDNLDNRFSALTPGHAGSPTGGVLSGACAGVPVVGANYLPHAIPLGTIAGGGVIHVDFTFAYQTCMTNGDAAPVFASAADATSSALGAGPLAISTMAFEDGVDPRSVRNGLGQLRDLDLSAYRPYDHQ